MNKEIMLKEIAALCVENIEDYREWSGVALHKIDMYRAPLSCVDSALFDRIAECIEEWAESSEYFEDVDEIYDYIDEEDVLFTEID